MQQARNGSISSRSTGFTAPMLMSRSADRASGAKTAPLSLSSRDGPVLPVTSRVHNPDPGPGGPCLSLLTTCEVVLGAVGAILIPAASRSCADHRNMLHASWCLVHLPSINMKNLRHAVSLLSSPLGGCFLHILTGSTIVRFLEFICPRNLLQSPKRLMTTLAFSPLHRPDGLGWHAKSKRTAPCASSS